MKKVVCQSCGMPLKNESDFGTDKNSSQSLEYCHFCFEDGEFTDEGITLQEKIDKNVGFAVKQGVAEKDARKIAQKIIPNLKRWKK